MNKVYFLLGSNLGNRTYHLAFARQELAIRIAPIIQSSKIYETAAWGLEIQPAFLNQVICLETALDPIDVLAYALKIEEDLGRTRQNRWESRILDVDMLYYGETIMRVSDLVLPHPRIQDRRFTLVPLAEIAPDFLHPQIKKSNQQLLDSCVDKLTVKIYNEKAE